MADDEAGPRERVAARWGRRQRSFTRVSIAASVVHARAHGGACLWRQSKHAYTLSLPTLKKHTGWPGTAEYGNLHSSVGPCSLGPAQHSGSLVRYTFPPHTAQFRSAPRTFSSAKCTKKPHTRLSASTRSPSLAPWGCVQGMFGERSGSGGWGCSGRSGSVWLGKEYERVERGAVAYGVGLEGGGVYK